MTESVMWPPPPPEPAKEEEGEEETTEEANPWEDRPAGHKLADVLQWLRNEHHYCVYCGCQVKRTPVPLSAYCYRCHQHAV